MLHLALGPSFRFVSFENKSKFKGQHWPGPISPPLGLTLLAGRTGGDQWAANGTGASLKVAPNMNHGFGACAQVSNLMAARWSLAGWLALAIVRLAL